MEFTSLSEIISYISDLNLRTIFSVLFLLPIKYPSQLATHLFLSILQVNWGILILIIVMRIISPRLTQLLFPFNS